MPKLVSNRLYQLCCRLLSQRFIRFLLVGGLNTVFGYCLWSFLLWLGLHYTLASAIGTIIAIIFNFKTTGGLVFNSHNNRLLLKFFGVYALVYIINIALLRVLELLNINLYLAGLIIILPVAFLSFVLMRNFVFKEQK